MRFSTLEKILKTRFSLIGIETKNSSTILDIFKQYQNTKGTPTYKWKQGLGLYRIDLAHVKIQNTASIEQVLNYIKKDQHQSIFIFTDFAEEMNNIFIKNTLINLCQPLSDSNFLGSRIVIMDKKLDFSIKFKGLVLETKKMLKMKIQRAA